MVISGPATNKSNDIIILSFLSMHQNRFPHRVSLVMTQFIILPFLQRHVNPRTLLQLACIALISAYAGITLANSLYQYLFITAVQTGAYAIAYAESSTQITRHFGYIKFDQNFSYFQCCTNE